MLHIAQHLCGFPDMKSEMPHKYWDWAGWNLGHLFVVEYDQRTEGDGSERIRRHRSEDGTVKKLEQRRKII